MKKDKKLRVIIITIFGTLLLIVATFFLYVSNYYGTEGYAKDMINKSYENIEVKYEDDSIEFIPKNIKAGFIFYPGGKVEYTAYAPLMISLAEEGVLCVIPHMTFNLAVFEIDAAKGICNRFDVDDWYIGGHSLGGAMASMYLGDHIDDFKGIVLLGAYANKDISNANIKALLVYGSNDGVMKRDNYESKKSYLPSDYKEVVINGGNHANFGAYGDQKKDGTATITKEEQVLYTKMAILELMAI